MSIRTELNTVLTIARHRLWPAPAHAALRAIRRRAEQAPRRTPGVIRLPDLELHYVDALSLAIQWEDIFVRRVLQFESAARSPVIFDCGANVGLATIWYRHAFPNARITAFEPDPQICATLRRNLALNRCQDVEVEQAAVWVTNDALEFRAEGTDAGAIDLIATDRNAPTVAVPAIRLRDRIEAQGVDLLKLDIEGAESAVLADIAPVLHRVAALQVEVHDMDVNRRLLPDCLATLASAGFDYALDDLTPATWRHEGQGRRGPFGLAVPAWVVLVRAWRRSA